MRISLHSFTLLVIGSTLALSACGPASTDTAVTTTESSSSIASSESTDVQIDADILLKAPTAEALITSPVQVSGMAKGYWFFEGQMPIKILDQDKNEIASGTAHAEGDWMSEGLVPFAGTVEFTTDAETGFLVMQKDNPSGEPENDKSMMMPVKFK